MKNTKNLFPIKDGELFILHKNGRDFLFSESSLIIRESEWESKLPLRMAEMFYFEETFMLGLIQKREALNNNLSRVLQPETPTQKNLLNQIISDLKEVDRMINSILST